MGKVNINVLLIGKSGSGKSSLINYLCGKEVEEVGVGKPITSKGLFEHIVEFDSCFLHVFDTWGLEPDKTEEWKDIIYEELRKRNTGSIKERFHFIVYCINVNSARIEKYLF